MIGAASPTTPGGTFCLNNADQTGGNENLSSTFELYQQFKIVGVAVKVFWAQPTTLAITPFQWQTCYSQNQIINPLTTPQTAQTLTNFQTGACWAGRPWSKYFPQY